MEGAHVYHLPSPSSLGAILWAIPPCRAPWRLRCHTYGPSPTMAPAESSPPLVALPRGWSTMPTPMTQARVRQPAWGGAKESASGSLGAGWCHGSATQWLGLLYLCPVAQSMGRGAPQGHKPWECQVETAVGQCLGKAAGWRAESWPRAPIGLLSQTLPGWPCDQGDFTPGRGSWRCGGWTPHPSSIIPFPAALRATRQGVRRDDCTCWRHPPCCPVSAPGDLGHRRFAGPF